MEGPFKRERCDAVWFVGNRPPSSVHDAHKENGKVRDGGAIIDDSHPILSGSPTYYRETLCQSCGVIPALC